MCFLSPDHWHGVMRTETGPELTLAQVVLQCSVSQLTTKTPERGLLDASHKHVSHRLTETTAPGWKESELGISGLRLEGDLLCTLTGQ